MAANALVGYAEQTRLQPYIQNSLIKNYTFHFLGQSFTFPTESLITQFLITLVFPNQFLNAGQDLPYLPGSSTPFPPSLTTFKSVAAKNVYLMFINQTDSLRGTAATDWGVLSQRMRFVVPLFRRSQFEKEIQSCPMFTPSQFQMIYNGKSPAGSDLCLDGDCCGNKKKRTIIKVN